MTALAAPFARSCSVASHHHTLSAKRLPVALAVAAGLTGLAAAGPALAAPGLSGFGVTNTDSVTAPARAVLGAASLAQVPKDATVTIALPTVTVVAPTPIPPPPEPDPEPVIYTPRANYAPPPSRSEPREIPASVGGNAVLEAASRYQGTPYVYGGSSSSGLDCSGFVQKVYGEMGVSLPHQSEAILSSGTVISAADAQPGDIIWTPGHVAIYAGDGQMIDASSSGGSVDFRDMWQSNPTFVRVG